MKEITNVSPERTLSIHVEGIGGDLRVRAGDYFGVSGKGHAGYELTEEEDFDMLRFEGVSSDLKLEIPPQASFHADGIGGDAKITEITGEIIIKGIGGDFVLRESGAARIGNVGGDILFKRMEGHVEIGNVGGDASLREIEGDIQVINVGGDAILRDVHGSARMKNVAGDLVLDTDFMPGTEHFYVVGGDAVIRIEEGTLARFRLPAGSKYRVDVEGAEIAENEEGDIVVTFGAGETAEIVLEAGGDIRFISPSEGFEFNFDFDFDFDFDDKMADFERTLAEQLAGISDKIAINAERITQKLSARAAEKAEMAAERAAAKAERAAAKAAERVPRVRFSPKDWSFAAPEPPEAPAAPAPPREPVSDEERMIILRMLEGGKISVEEAERLLKALESR